MPRHHMIRGEKVPFTDDEETARDAEEKAWEDAKPTRAFISLRIKRNQLLQETDFYSCSDVTMSNDMKTYRQALRDFPATLNNTTVLQTITSPSKP